MSFDDLRGLFTTAALFFYLLVPRIFTMVEIPYFPSLILLSLPPITLVLIHCYLVKKHQKDFDSPAYLPAIMNIAVFTTLGSFSKDELIEFGFRFLTTEPIWSYFAIKSTFFFWSLILLPVVLDKFFKKP